MCDQCECVTGLSGCVTAAGGEMWLEIVLAVIYSCTITTPCCSPAGREINLWKGKKENVGEGNTRRTKPNIMAAPSGKLAEKIGLSQVARYRMSGHVKINLWKEKKENVEGRWKVQARQTRLMRSSIMRLSSSKYKTKLDGILFQIFHVFGLQTNETNHSKVRKV